MLGQFVFHTMYVGHNKAEIARIQVEQEIEEFAGVAWMVIPSLLKLLALVVVLQLLVDDRATLLV